MELLATWDLGLNDGLPKEQQGVNTWNITWEAMQVKSGGCEVTENRQILESSNVGLGGTESGEVRI